MNTDKFWIRFGVQYKSTSQGHADVELRLTYLNKGRMAGMKTLDLTPGTSGVRFLRSTTQPQDIRLRS